MFRTPVARAVSPFSLFLKQNKGSFISMKTLAKKYAALNAADKSTLVAAAAKKEIKYTQATTKKFALKAKKRAVNLKAFGKSPYAKFVKANYASVKDLPVQKRMGAIAKLWKKQA
jgi:hypothetical protein